MSREAAAPPVPGSVVVDEQRGRVGEVAGRGPGGALRLRPLRGGREWAADPARVRRATPAERLHATLAAVNAASRSGRS
ncbi:hypothetical protein [Streptomyces sp. WMMB 322]|uniref:hypothetical protein n=1 Tax=Streptomyces sp. WMMB 322 TaxID=1286821 RepID=UPI0006E463A7|nr:hypothetical protein [Streptomyces sp. WMMB 322]SCK12301.1 hypothetical protein H180DRAFT_00707 [Streptomyces sp. WMMB 322]